jgi:hypothetical protein
MPDAHDHGRHWAGLTNAGMLALRPRRAKSVRFAVASGQSPAGSDLKNNSDRLLISAEAFGVSSPNRAHNNILIDGNAGR